MRAKFQVLVIPYIIEDNGEVKYCIFKRSDLNIYQFISGGGEDDESPIEACMRECNEEAGLDYNLPYKQLDSLTSIPSSCFKEARKHWGKDVLIIPEYSFCVKLDSKELSLSSEHTEYNWVNYEIALEKLKYDGNKTALFELHNRIINKTI